MRLWVLLWAVVVAAVSVFSFVNWQVLTAQTAINLLVAQVTAPLGLVMLGGMAALTLLFVLFLVWVETKALIQMGRGNPQAGLERQLGEFRAESADTMRNVIARLEHVEQVVRDELGRASHNFVAHVDRLEPTIKRAG